MHTFSKTATAFALLLSISLTAQAQSKKTKRPKAKPVAAATPAPELSPVAEPEPAKKNGRPAESIDPKSSKTISKTTKPNYFYEFTRPGWVYSKILIEHDENGKGTISFLKDGFDEMITDPVDLSQLTLTKINDALAALNYFDSTENYQYSKDYSHLGNTQITVRKNGRERTVKYNWTENKNAKILMDEYRRIANEGTWRFEMISARENQPLLTPGLMDTLDSYLKRGEISDPLHLTPFLTELSTDERLPLMARNHAVKLLKQTEKKK